MRDFNIAAVEECVFERNWLSHKVNLFEMNSKYADVVFLDEALALPGSWVGCAGRRHQAADRACRLYPGLAVIDVTPDGLDVREMVPGIPGFFSRCNDATSHCCDAIY